MATDVLVVHTRGSACRCHLAIGSALEKIDRTPLVVDCDFLLSDHGSVALRARVAFDHVDVVMGKSALRNEPRRLLEKAGVSVAGGTAAACALADDKALAREAYARASVPIPRGATISDADESVDLTWPRVLKAAREHMSRGLAVVHDATEQRERARKLLATFGPPLVVEEFIGGRELAVTLVDRGSGPEALPVAEWPLARDVLGEAEKLDAVTFPFVAKLDDATRDRVVDAALRAFRALGLRDYARVDLRLDAAGRPFVLETNPRPSLEPDAPTAISAKAIGRDVIDVVAWALERAEARAR